MAKITKIRISKNDRKEYARLVRNAKAKIRRTLKNHKVDLHGEVHLPSSIDSFTTRKEFNEWKEDIQSFTNRYNLRYQFVTNKYGVTTDKATIAGIQRRRRREQNVARQEINRIKDEQVKVHGKPHATVGQRMQLLGESEIAGVTVPKDFKFDEVRDKGRLQEIIEVGKKRQYPKYYDERKERMKDNFIVALSDSFNNEADELIERIYNMMGDDFYHVYITNEEFDFDELYYDYGEIIGLTNTEEQVTKLMAILDRFENETRNNKLDDF